MHSAGFYCSWERVSMAYKRRAANVPQQPHSSLRTAIDAGLGFAGVSSVKNPRTMGGHLCTLALAGFAAVPDHLRPTNVRMTEGNHAGGFHRQDPERPPVDGLRWTERLWRGRPSRLSRAPAQWLGPRYFRATSSARSTIPGYWPQRGVRDRHQGQRELLRVLWLPASTTAAPRTTPTGAAGTGRRGPGAKANPSTCEDKPSVVTDLAPHPKPELR